MSIFHSIIPKIELDIFVFQNILEEEKGIIIQENEENYFYIWGENKSTRGVELSIEEEKIELRNPILSNSFDYNLTNKIIDNILQLTNGILYDEDGLGTQLPVFSDNQILELEIADCNTIMNLALEKNEIEIFGPYRNVYFGFDIYEKLRNKLVNPSSMVESVFEIILHIQYNLPDFVYGNVLQVGTEDNQKIMKLITNKVNCLIIKYDNILLQRDDEEASPIMITNKLLNTILPQEWELVDEFTIIAPIIADEKWKLLLNKANELDQYDSY